MLDYLVGRYMRLMYICFYQTHSDNKALLKDVAKFAYFYNVANIDSQTIESLSKEYIESIVGPDENDQNEEETKKNLIHKYKRFMMSRHSNLLENEAMYVRLKYKIAKKETEKTKRSPEDRAKEGQQIMPMVQYMGIPEKAF